MIEEVLIFGTVEGLILALLALGFSLVYGVGGVLNLAHGAFYLIACYVLYWALTLLRFPLIISIIMTLAIVMALGAASYLGLIEPLQDSHIGVVIATFSLAFFLQQLVIVALDPKYHGLLNAIFIQGVIFIFLHLRNSIPLMVISILPSPILLLRIAVRLITSALTIIFPESCSLV